MLNNIVGMYLSDKYGITTDQILFTVSITANDSHTFTISEAVNGAKLKSDLSSFDYLATKYSIWSQNGMLDVTIKPDNESVNQLKTVAFTQKTEAPIVPPKQIRTDLAIYVTNSQDIDDDLFLAIEIFRIPQGKVPELMDTGGILFNALDNIDIQTLAIEKYIIYSNELTKTIIDTNLGIIELLKALIIANGGTVPDIGDIGIPDISDILKDIPSPPGVRKEPTRACRRT